MQFILELIYLVYEEVKFWLYYKPLFVKHLTNSFAYYDNLPPKHKSRFLRLVRDHYDYFEFIPRQNITITNRMKALISAGASQLVLNLPDDSLTFFEKIIVYSDYYHSRITNKLHKGEVNPGLRIIVFSWRGVLEGLNRNDDGLNLLLHEFAHAIWLENKIMHKEYTLLSPTSMNFYEQAAEEEVVKMKNDEQHFFRRYALTNKEEFFAVAVENFFERPTGLNVAAPKLYQSLVSLFRQDPLASRFSTDPFSSN